MAIDRQSDATIYRLCMADIYQVAEDSFGVRSHHLTDAELREAINGIEGGFGSEWWEVVEEALRDAFATSGRQTTED